MESLYHFQKIVALLSEKTMASELLLRTFGKNTLSDALVKPEILVNNIDALTDSKVHHAIKLREEQGVSNVFVNYSPKQVESEGFLRALDKLDELIEIGMIVVIEITEDDVFDSLKRLSKHALIAKEKGFAIAIDDFGAGQANFNALFDLQPSIVKLDRKLIAQATKSNRGQDGFYQLIELCKNMHFKVVVEGIETKEELAIARKSHAEFAQGYYFHKPSVVSCRETKKQIDGDIKLAPLLKLNTAKA